MPLFTTRVGRALQQTDINPQYVVAPDGQRFLMNTVIEGANTSPITVILNWKAKPWDDAGVTCERDRDGIDHRCLRAAPIRNPFPPSAPAAWAKSTKRATHGSDAHRRHQAADGTT